jgi:hypothetical protein
MTDDGTRFARRKQFIAFVLVLAVVNVAYRLVYASGLSRTAALYVGVPTLLAIGLALTPRSSSATGMLIKGSLLALLVACVILPEGLLCLLFAVPLVTVIAAVVGGSIDYARRHNRGQGPTLMAVSIPLFLMSLEGVAGSPFDSHDAATAHITVPATPAQVAAALAAPPRFDTPLPPFLTVGFNRPVGATGSGVEVGDTRAIEFNGGTHDDHPLRLFGLGGHRSVDHHAEMHLRVVESGPSRVVFRVDHDGTMLSRWVRLDRAVVTWRPHPPNGTAGAATDATDVRWTLEYERLLYPTVYFAPLQGWGLDQAAGYLLDAVVKEQLR